MYFKKDLYTEQSRMHIGKGQLGPKRGVKCMEQRADVHI